MLTDPAFPAALSGLFGTGTVVVLVASLRDKRRSLALAPKPAADERPVPAKRER